jgi:hypothetical protein
MANHTAITDIFQFVVETRKGINYYYNTVIGVRIDRKIVFSHENKNTSYFTGGIDDIPRC